MTTAEQTLLFTPCSRRDRFDTWIETAEGRECLKEFIAWARALIRIGKRPSAKYIVERMRREGPVKGDPAHAGFKIDNRLTAPLVRAAIAAAPDLDGHFVLKNTGG